MTKTQKHGFERGDSGEAGEISNQQSLSSQGRVESAKMEADST